MSDTLERCLRCGQEAHAEHADGRIEAYYGSSHDTTVFIVLGNSSDREAALQREGAVCDTCIARLLEGRKISPISCWANPDRIEVSRDALEASFRYGVRTAGRLISEQQGAGPESIEKIVALIGGAINLPRPTDETSLVVDLRPVSSNNPDGISSGRAYALAAAAIGTSYTEEALAKAAELWANRVKRDEKDRTEFWEDLGSFLNEGQGRTQV